MKVCMLAYALYLTDARIKAYVKSLEEKGMKIDVIALKEKGKGASENLDNGVIYYLTRKYQGNLALRYISSYFVFYFAALVKLTFLYLRKKYDIIHVHNMPNFIVFAAFVPKILGAKIILDVHDLMTVNYMTRFDVGENHWMIKLLEVEQTISARFANHVICADHLQKKFLIEYGVPREKIIVIMNVANEEIFRPIVGKKDTTKFNLIYHGTIAERLGIDILLRSVALIKGQIPVFLSVYGEGDFLGNCLTLKKELGLDDCVYFSESFFAVERVPELVSNMDVGVVPEKKTLATYNFGLPVKLMEYVYLQIPVIAPRLQIIKYYFDETMVKYFEPENIEDLARCILELYENPDERKELVKDANKFIQKHNWKEQERVYFDLLGVS